MANYDHPLLHGLSKRAYTPPPQGGAPGGDPAAGGGGPIPPELMQIMMGGAPGGAGGPGAGMPPGGTGDPGAGLPPGGPGDPGMGGGLPSMDASMPPGGPGEMPPGGPGEPGGEGSPNSGDVTMDEAAQVSPDVVSSHATQLQSALAVLQEGIRQLRRVVDAISESQAAGGAASMEEPKSAHYRGIKPDVNSLLDALKYLG